MSLPVLAQKSEGRDSLVILMSSKSAQVVDIDGASYRKVVGPARFLHNDTYLLCDTAYWNVETKIIDAWGNVSLLQAPPHRVAVPSPYEQGKSALRSEVRDEI